MTDLIAIRQLCAEHWNPIGIPMANSAAINSPAFPGWPEDEYDNYLLYAAGLISSGSSLEIVVEYLGRVESENLSLSTTAGDKRKFVAALID
jgi:hypothetical protein